MTTKNELLTLANQASLALGIPRNEAIAYSLRLVLSMSPPVGTDSRGPDEVLGAASRLMETMGSFTMDDLLDEVYGDSPIFSPHKVKIFAAKLLTASGYTRRQFRRGNRRPLLWYKHSMEQ
ncbi:MAG: hypothetical protein Unbinned80contig1000_38 [Prokaryotic dsDNA virus sp.]|nr:MAG: hypothetical protein Unbinned80contig1000_38 [Prokaryotic dsDNA virus sp.]